MKNIIIGILSTGLLLTRDAKAELWQMGRLHLNADVGIALQQDATLVQSFSGVVALTKSISFNPGIRTDVTFGYDLNKSWSLELETGFIWTSADSFGPIIINTFTHDTSIDFYQVPILFNVAYRLPLTERWTAYVGAGAGGVYSVIAGDFFTSGSDFNFAYQAQLGVNYEITKRVSVGFGYKFFGSLDPVCNTSELGAGAIENTTSLKGVYTHSLTASIMWKFD